MPSGVELLPAISLQQQLKFREYAGWVNGLNTSLNALSISPTELSDGQNVQVDDSPGLAKRAGSTQAGVFGMDSPVRGLWSFETQTGGTNQLKLMAAVVNGGTTEIYHDNGTGTISSANKFTNTFASITASVEAMIRPDTGIVYIHNGVNSIIKWDGTTESTLGTAALLGKFLVFWKNRIFSANRASNRNRIDFTQEFSETVETNGFAIIGDEDITTMFVFGENLYVGNTRELYMIDGIDVINATIGLSLTRIRKLPGVRVGPVSHRTVKVVNGRVYWLGADGHIYEFNGLTATNISKQRIKRTMEAVNLTQLTLSNAASFQNKYFLFYPVTAATTANRCIVYDTNVLTDANGIVSQSRFYTVWTGRNSTVMTVHDTSSGEERLYYADGTFGAVYRMETGNYDEVSDQSQITGYDTDIAVTASTTQANRRAVAQSFQLSATEVITAVAVVMKRNAGTNAELTCRIETNSSGVPSGTLENSNLTTTLSAFSTTDYRIKLFTFPNNTATTTLSTTKWAVIQHTDQTTGDSDYRVEADGSSPGYANGNVATHNGTSWTAVAGQDLLFIIFTRKAIDGYGDTKADDLGYPLFIKRLKYLMGILKSGSVTVEIGWTNHALDSVAFDSVDTSTGSTTWDSSGPWDQNTLNWDAGATLSEQKADLTNLKCRYVRCRIRNRSAAADFTCYRLMLAYSVKLRVTETVT